jgi:hypothetical protein
MTIENANELRRFGLCASSDPSRGRLARTARIAGRAALLAILVAPALVLGQTQPPVDPDTDPLGSPNAYTLLRDDELFVLHMPSSGQQPGPDGISFNTYEIDANFNATSQADYVNDFNWATESHQFFTANGRPLVPDKDNVVVAQRSGASDVQLRFFTLPTHQARSYTLPDTPLAPRLGAPSTDFMDLAVGDLDNRTDSAGAYHDEVVVAWAKADSTGRYYTPNISVIDYTSATADPTRPEAITSAVSTKAIDTSLWSTNGPITPSDNALSIALGDFDGDGVKEIALATLVDATAIWLTPFRYTTDDAGNHSLDPLPPVQVMLSGTVAGTVDLAAANGDGDVGNKDELFLSSSSVSLPWLDVFEADANLQLSRVSSTTLDGYHNSIYLGAQCVPRVQLVPGLFKYDPATGYDINRRQVAVFNQYCLAGGGGQWAEIHGSIYALSSDRTQLQHQTNIDVPTSGAGGDSYSSEPGQRWVATAGGFRGNHDVSDPTWWMALAVWDGTAPNPYTIWRWKGSGDAWHLENWTPTLPFDYAARPAIINTDYDGDSTVLGAPVHIEAENLVRTDYVLQEPPKHAYWDPTKTYDVNREADATANLAENATRYGAFDVSLNLSDSSSYKFTTKNNSAWNISTGIDESAKETATEGKDSGKLQASAEEILAFTGAARYGYDKSKSTVDQQYGSVQRSVSSQTSGSDWVQGQTQVFDIWRYRIYGTSFTDTATGQPSNGFYEVTIPGAVLPFQGDPANFDWYQPIYENGNILSYPQPQAGANPFVPPDVGSFDIVDPTTGAVLNAGVNGILRSAEMIMVDSSSTSDTLEYKGAVKSGETVSYSNSLQASADISFTLEANVKIPIVGGDQLTSTTNLSIGGGYSWGGVSTAESTTTLSTGIALNQPGNQTTGAYAFYPAFYITGDGTTKVAHAADVEASSTGKAFWHDLYNQKPDAALNLPWRFNPVYDAATSELNNWSPNTAATRKQLRGFAASDPVASPVSGTYPLLSGPAEAGTCVRLTVPVYNYTTSSSRFSLASLPVNFYAVAYDESSDSESGPRTLLGSTTVSIGPQGVKTAELLWNAAQLPGSGTLPGSQQSYRIYVVLDPGNTVDETYDTEPAGCSFTSASSPPCNPGQNNEGWGLLTVLTPPAGTPIGPACNTVSLAVAGPKSAVGLESVAGSRSLRAQQADPAPAADLSLGPDAFAAKAADGTLHSGTVTAALGEPMRLRVAVSSDQDLAAHGLLSVFDGAPGEGVETIAMKQVQGIAKGSDRYVWLDWQPRSTGRHELHAVISERREDPVPGNNVARLSVIVDPVDPCAGGCRVYLPVAERQ